MHETKRRTLVRIGAAGLVALLLSTGTPVPTLATGGEDDLLLCVEPLVARDLIGERTCLTAGGLIRIQHNNGDIGYVVPPEPTSSLIPLPEESPERSIACSDGTQQHIRVIYAHPGNLPSRYEEKIDAIRTYVERANFILHASAWDSSDGTIGADLRVLCDDSGEIAVEYHESSTTSFEDSFGMIHSEISPGRKELAWVFYDDSSSDVCGLGHLIHDDRLIRSNPNMRGGRTALVFGLRGSSSGLPEDPLGSDDGCWETRTPLHELGHNLGAVQEFAPFSSGAHCEAFRDQDIMCYDDNGNGQVEEDCPRDSNTFDCGYDTYADALPEPGEWLESHWNIFVNLAWAKFENPFLRWEYGAEPSVG